MSENIKQRKPRLILQSEIYIYIINILPAFLGKKIYIFPTVKSALLLLFNITITLFRKSDKMHAVLFLSHLQAIAMN